MRWYRIANSEADDLIARIKDAVQRGWILGKTIKWDEVDEALRQGDPEAMEYLRNKAAEIEPGRKMAEEEAERELYESQAAELDVPVDPQQLEELGDQDVWLYHGTSTALLPQIMEEGLGGPSAPTGETQGRGAFLTAYPGGGGAIGGSAMWYARGATRLHGGEPVILRVKVPASWLEFDPDDVDLTSGRYQFLVPHVPPEMIMEIDGEPV